MIPFIIKSIGDWIATHWRGVSCYVAGVLTVVLLLFWCEKPVPQPTTRIETKFDTIRTHDTITRSVPISQVVRHYVHDTVLKSVHDTTVLVKTVVVDSESCISGSFAAPDSAKVSWSACSKEFPFHFSEKISWDVKYVAPPRIVQHDTRYDTIPIGATAWQRVKTATLWVTVGTVIGAGVVEYFTLKR